MHAQKGEGWGEGTTVTSVHNCQRSLLTELRELLYDNDYIVETDENCDMCYVFQSGSQGSYGEQLNASYMHGKFALEVSTSAVTYYRYGTFVFPSYRWPLG